MKIVIQFVLLCALLSASASADDLRAAIAAASGSDVKPGDVEVSVGTSLSCDPSQVRITNLRHLHDNLHQASVRCVTSTALPVLAWIRMKKRAGVARPTSATSVSKAAPLLVRAGELVKLQLLRRGMVISLPAVCLSAGRQGDSVRVTDTTGRLHYKGKVISAGFVRGEVQ